VTVNRLVNCSLFTLSVCIATASDRTYSGVEIIMYIKVVIIVVILVVNYLPHRRWWEVMFSPASVCR